MDTLIDKKIQELKADELTIINGCGDARPTAIVNDSTPSSISSLPKLPDLPGWPKHGPRN